MRVQALHTALRFLARGTSLATLGMIGAFLVGEGDGLSRLESRELALFACFPVGVCLGLVLGWWRELLGGALALVSLAAFYVVHTLGSGDLPSGIWFALLTSPAVLFLASWAVGRRAAGAD